MQTDFREITAKILKQKGFSEAELAKEIGTTQPTVNRIKLGKIKVPNFELGQRLIELSKVTA